MIFNCTSFHIFNANFYSIIWHDLRILRITIISFLWVMHEYDYEWKRVLKVYGIVYSYRWAYKSYEMLHVHSCF